MQAQGQQMEEYVARNFAEALGRLFAKKLRLMVKVGKAFPIKVDGQAKMVDPTKWPEGLSANVRVGLGSGRKDQRLGNIATWCWTCRKRPCRWASRPRSTSTTTFRTAPATWASIPPTCSLIRIARKASRSHRGLAQSAAQQPNPEQQKMQAQVEQAQAKLQIDQQKAQSDFVLKQQKIQGDHALDAGKAQTEAELEANRLQTETQLNIMEMQSKEHLAHRQAEMSPSGLPRVSTAHEKPASPTRPA
jgi:hypothetical protein